MQESEKEPNKKKRSKVKIIGNTIYWLFIGTLLLFAGLTVFSKLEAPGGFRVYTVQSGSMEPAVRAGGIVVVKSVNTYQAGDVITFYPDANNTKTPPTTHRIVEVHDNELLTKGDANEDNDREAITKSQVLGKVFITFPYLGYVINFSRTQMGFIVLIVIPAVLIVYSELGNIKKEILGLKNKKQTIVTTRV